MKKKARPTDRRRGFTLIEVMVAGLLTAFLLGSISMTLSQLGRAKNTCKQRLEAHLRADLALNAIRRDVASILRSDDLLYTRFQLTDGLTHTALGDMDRDEVLLFVTRLRPIRDMEFNGEGMEFETQYRIDSDRGGLWQRRDAFPDKYPRGGGKASPLVQKLIGLNIEVYDGEQWYDDWDSDYDGLPLAVRVTVTSSGARPDQPLHEAVTATLRTVIPIDRVLPPAELFRLTPEEEADINARVLFEPTIGAGNAAAGGASNTGAGGGRNVGVQPELGAGGRIPTSSARDGTSSPTRVVPKSVSNTQGREEDR